MYLILCVLFICVYCYCISRVNDSDWYLVGVVGSWILAAVMLALSILETS